MPDRFHPPAFVPACGLGTRFGGSGKLTEPVDGFPILQRTLVTLRAGGASRLLVGVRPGDRSLLAALLPVPGWAFLEIPGWEEGMSASYRWVAPLFPPDVPFVLACPADLPWLRAETVARVIEAANASPGRMVVPYHADRPGHPVAVPAALLARAGELRGEEGFRRWRDDAHAVVVDDPGAVRDVDRPEDLAG